MRVSSPSMTQPSTRRELDALRAVCQPGGSMKGAAHELGGTEHAVHRRLRSLYGRLGVSSAAQASYALGLGREVRPEA